MAFYCFAINYYKNLTLNLWLLNLFKINKAIQISAEKKGLTQYIFLHPFMSTMIGHIYKKFEFEKLTF